jgi:predicted ATPase
MTARQHFFNRLAIYQFRRLREVKVEIRPLTVLIGANGAGKTSFLDVWALLAESAAGRLQDYLAARGGLAEILTRDKPDAPPDEPKPLHLELAMTVPGFEPLAYRVKLMPSGNAYLIIDEELSQHKPGKNAFLHISCRGNNIHYFDSSAKKLLRPTWEHSPMETSLSQVPKMFKEPELFRRQLASSTYYGPLNVSPQAPVRLPQPMRPADLPGRNGEDLVSCLFSMRESDRERFEMVEDALRAAFSDFERLDFPPVAAGVLSMTWKDKCFRRPMYLSQLSEGTLRYLWLATLLSAANLPAVTLIDEPEVSLHPELLSQLVELMREASRRTQLVVATHSDRLIRFLEPKEVVVCDVEAGDARLQWADQLDLDRWLKDYTLDQIWQMGQLGGRA